MSALAPPPTGRPRSGTARVLLVEDDPDHALLFELATRGGDVEVVDRIDHLADLPAAVAAEDPDVVVLDVWLGDQGRTTDRLDEIHDWIGPRRLIVWTHDVAIHAELTSETVVDKMSSGRGLLAVILGDDGHADC